VHDICSIYGCNINIDSKKRRKKELEFQILIAAATWLIWLNSSGVFLNKPSCPKYGFHIGWMPEIT
jgi:hypothetical protein